jgi:hypothetical protein
MNIITTTAPIGLEDLKKYFNDKTVSYVIDYANSKLQGAKLLTYISNLDLPIDIQFDPKSTSGKELLKEYLESTFMISVPSLEMAAMQLLFEYKFENLKDEFVEQNTEILNLWVRLLESCTLYNMYAINEEQFKDFVRQHPEERFEVFKGINFVQLLKYSGFYLFYETINENNLRFMPEVFDNYVFKGKNLYNFWANENNPLFLLTWAIATGEVTGEQYVEMKKNSIAEISNATPV